MSVARIVTIVDSGIIGLALGSFISVLAYRLPRKLSLLTLRSHCPSCGVRIRAIDNVPVISWIVLHGRCHSCRAPISLRYPLVEGAFGAVGVAIAFGLQSAAPLPVLGVLFVCGIAAVSIDASNYSTPWTLGVAAVIAWGGFVAISLVEGSPRRLIWSAASALAAGVMLIFAPDLWHHHDRKVTNLAGALVVSALTGAVGWLWFEGAIAACIILGIAVIQATAVTTDRARSSAHRGTTRSRVPDASSTRPWPGVLSASLGYMMGLIIAGSWIHHAL